MWKFTEPSNYMCPFLYPLKLNLFSLGFAYLSHKTHSMKFSWKLPNLALVEIWAFIDLKANFAPQVFDNVWSMAHNLVL